MSSYEIDEKLGFITPASELPLAPPNYETFAKAQLGGVKHDGGKPDLSLIPRHAAEAIARALMYGEGKYGRNNYLRGFKSYRLVAAALRHIFAWQSGEETDPESGLSHLDHAIACLAMLIQTVKIGTTEVVR